MIVARILFVIKFLNYHYHGITIKLESYHVSLSFSTLCLDTRQPGSVFKILHTRQSEIILEFPRKNQSNPPQNYRSLLRNAKRFQL